MVASRQPQELPAPAVDERLVMPETRYEIIDGQVVYVSPADYPHASRHSKLSALLETHAAIGFEAASDMLTRTSAKGDMAPDGSIFPEDPDPITGGRQLEHLAFEIASTETLSHAGIKAARLMERGVRRVFAIDVERKRALEWSTATESWQILRNDDSITDLALVTPLPIAALVGAADIDDALVRALAAKNNTALTELRNESRDVGRNEAQVEGLRRQLLVVLRVRGLAMTPAQAALVAACHDVELLTRWNERAETDTLEAIFA